MLPLWVQSLLSTDTLHEGARRVLVLDGVQDPGNLGTLVRTAAALAWDAVYLTDGCCDPFSDKAIRSSRGATLQVCHYFLQSTTDSLASAAWCMGDGITLREQQCRCRLGREAGSTLLSSASDMTCTCWRQTPRSRM